MWPYVAITIGAKRARPLAKAKAKETVAETPRGEAAAVPPEGYEHLTVAEIKKAAGSWDADTLGAALAYERANAQRKGAIAALESGIAREKEGR